MKVLFIVLTGVLVLVNSFFVIAEYALVRSRRERLEAIVEDGPRRQRRGARTAMAQMDSLSDYISACQVGITMASIGIGALGEPAIAHVLELAFGHKAADWAVAVAVVIAYVIITFAQSVIGEIVPKLYTIQHAESLIIRIAPLMRIFIGIFKPFIVALNASSEWMLRLLGVDPDATDSEAGTPEELKRLIAASQTGGQLDAGEAQMLTGVFHLHEQEARQVMTPIPAVVTVDISATVGEGLETCIRTGHSRLVVTENDDEDQVKGIVHVNQLVKTMLQRGSGASFAERVRQAPIVPETKPLDDLLADLQRERTELAIVVDEYGRTAGIVTIEDIIEEVVGEISDETDPAGGAIRRLANGDWFVRGHVAVADLDNYGFDLPVDTDAYNSVGGYVFAELGRLPKRGDQIDAPGYNIRVEAVRQNRVEAVRIREVARPPEPDEDDDDDS
jgi:CBS domain containing-hemolysin-like protein